MGAENSAAGGIDCRGFGSLFDEENPHLLGFFTMAWGLLIVGHRG
jgi:hypothetical protein